MRWALYTRYAEWSGRATRPHATIRRLYDHWERVGVSDALPVALNVCGVRIASPSAFDFSSGVQG